MVKNPSENNCQEHFELRFRQGFREDYLRDIITHFYKQRGYAVPDDVSEFNEYYDFIFTKGVKTLCVAVTIINTSITKVAITVLENEAGLFAE